MRAHSPASPTKTSCGGLKGPSPTALYTLSRISYRLCLLRSTGKSGGQEHRGHRVYGMSPLGGWSYEGGRRHSYHSSTLCDTGEETAKWQASPADRNVRCKAYAALGSQTQLNHQLSSVETEGGSINSPGHSGPEGQTFLACTLPAMADTSHFCHAPAVSPPVPIHLCSVSLSLCLFLLYSTGARDGIQCLFEAEHRFYY